MNCCGERASVMVVGARCEDGFLTSPAAIQIDRAPCPRLPRPCFSQGVSQCVCRAGGVLLRRAAGELSAPMTVSTATKPVLLRPVLLQQTCAPHPPESIAGSQGLWRDASHHSSLLGLTCRGDTKNSLQDSPALPHARCLGVLLMVLRAG